MHPTKYIYLFVHRLMSYCTYAHYKICRNRKLKRRDDFFLKVETIVPALLGTVSLTLKTAGKLAALPVAHGDG